MLIAGKRVQGLDSICASFIKLSSGELLNVFPSYIRNWAGELRTIGLCGIARGLSLYCSIERVAFIPTVTFFHLMWETNTGFIR